MFKIISSYSRVHRCFHSVGRAMSEPVPLILRLIAASIPIANHAGKIIRDVMKTGELKIVEKGIEDFQTKADRLAQQYIVTAISRQFPDVHIIGEEDGATEVLVPEVDIKDTFDPEVLQKNIPNELANVTQNQITVWVDPLDGTSEYTKGLLEHVTVLIGVSVDGQSVAGVVHQPYYGYKEKTECGRTLWGIPGLGIFGLDLKPPPTNKRIITTTRSHNNETVQKTIDSMKADEVIKVGGAGYKVILLLEGKAHAYVFASAGSKRWDTCAPEALLHAAGGLLTDVTGTFYKYDKEVDFVNRRGVLAVAKKEQHEEYLKLIPNDVKESFQK